MTAATTGIDTAIAGTPTIAPTPVKLKAVPPSNKVIPPAIVVSPFAK